LSNRPLGSVLVFSTALKRVMLVLASGALAVTGLLIAPSASAQPKPTPTLNYSLRTSIADLTHVQNGDPLKITISGLKATASAEWKICPDVLPDNLVTPRGVPNHKMVDRFSAYCAKGGLNDELSGKAFGGRTLRGRSAVTGDITFDVPVPRGSITPQVVLMDPAYTSASFNWANNPNKNKYSFSCDENHPCSWGLHITGPFEGSWPLPEVYDTSIKFAPAAAGIKIQGCGGIGTATLDASVPERFGRTLVSWNQLLCAPTRAAQPTNIVAENEDNALKSFDTGASTIAITGSGSALAAQHVRDRQYVPVGLNATVVAAVGWSPTDLTDPNPRSVPLESKLTASLKFSWDDLANLLSKGSENPYGPGRGGIFQDTSALVQRNAALAAIRTYDGSYQQGPVKRSGWDPGYGGVTGEAGKGTVPLQLSSTLAKSAPGSWVYGTGGEFHDPIDNTKVLPGSGTPVGTVTDLTSLNLGAAFVHNVDTKSGKLAVRKQVFGVTLGGGVECVGGCLNWVVTDLATATENGWAPVAVPNGQGGYVAPTPQSLQAAATHLTQGADGSLTPGVTSGDPNAYPLAFVESITAPLNPLVDTNCQPEKAKQDQLTTLLRAATNGGQSAMGPGLVPLSPEFLATAQTAAAKVGTGTSAAACKENTIAQATAAGTPPPAGTGTGSATTIPPGPPGPFGSAGSLGSPLPSSTASPLPISLMSPTKVPTATSVQDSRKLADSVRIPDFFGAGPLGALAPLLALAALVVLPSATAYLMAGRPLPPWLAQFRRQTGERLSRLAQRARGARFAAAGGGA
jgi:hypothetical protein